MDLRPVGPAKRMSVSAGQPPPFMLFSLRDGHIPQYLFLLFDQSNVLQDQEWI
jgi:hypothetical protein